MITEHFFDDKDSLFAALSTDCQARLKQALLSQSKVSLLASGGSSPSPLYKVLSDADLDWSRVDVALVDERWVDEDHTGSNTALVKKTLLRSNAAAANFVAMKNVSETALDGLPTCEQSYQGLAQPFALTILGMGPDGHTASLFPNAQGLERALDLQETSLCSAITASASDVTGALVERMSLSLNGLLKSDRIHLLITGQEKLDVYKRAIEAADVHLTPVSAILQQQQIPVEVYWAP